MFINTFGNCIFDSSKQRTLEGWRRILRSPIKMVLGMVSGYMPCKIKEKEIQKSVLYLAVLHSSIEREKSDKLILK